MHGREGDLQTIGEILDDDSIDEKYRGKRIVWSRDRDLFQLVNESGRMVSPRPFTRAELTKLDESGYVRYLSGAREALRGETIATPGIATPDPDAPDYENEPDPTLGMRGYVITLFLVFVAFSLLRIFWKPLVEGIAAILS